MSIVSSCARVQYLLYYMCSILYVLYMDVHAYKHNMMNTYYTRDGSVEAVDLFVKELSAAGWPLIERHYVFFI